MTVDVTVCARSGHLWQKWATPLAYHRAGLSWHSPNEAEVAAAQGLLGEFCGIPLKQLASLSHPLDASAVPAVRNAIDCLRACVRGAAFALFDTLSPQGGWV